MDARTRFAFERGNRKVAELGTLTQKRDFIFAFDEPELHCVRDKSHQFSLGEHSAHSIVLLKGHRANWAYSFPGQSSVAHIFDSSERNIRPAPTHIRDTGDQLRIRHVVEILHEQRRFLLYWKDEHGLAHSGKVREIQYLVIRTDRAIQDKRRKALFSHC